MRALWIDSGNDPEWEKVTAYKITSLFFDLLDPRVTPAYLAQWVARQKTVGVYAVSSWPSLSGGGQEFAEKVSARLSPISPNIPKVQLDVEQHDAQFVIDAITRWRELRPIQATSWTMEPFQVGWMTQELIDLVIRERIRVVPQYYLGNMAPVAADRAALEFVKRGVPASQVSGFYDAAALPIAWDGWAFTQGRLP